MCDVTCRDLKATKDQREMTETGDRRETRDTRDFRVCREFQEILERTARGDRVANRVFRDFV